MEYAFSIYILVLGIAFCLFVGWICWNIFKMWRASKKKPSHPIILTDRDIDGDLLS